MAVILESNRIPLEPAMAPEGLLSSVRAVDLKGGSCVAEAAASGLSKSDPFLLVLEYPHEEHDFPWAGMMPAISSTRQRAVLSFHRLGEEPCASGVCRTLIGRTHHGMVKCTIGHSRRTVLAQMFAHGMNLSCRAGNAAPAPWWCWATFGEQSRVISRERRSSGSLSGYSEYATAHFHAVELLGRISGDKLRDGNVSEDDVKRAHKSGAYRHFHNLTYLEYAHIRRRYRGTKHSIDIIARQYQALPD